MMNYYRMLAITPNDGVDLAAPCRGIFVGVTGNISLIQLSDTGAATPVVFKGVPAGTILPVMARRIRSTGTTATDLVALW